MHRKFLIGSQLEVKLPHWGAFGYVGMGLFVIKNKEKCTICVQRVSAKGSKCPIAGGVGEEKSFSFYPLTFKGRPTNPTEKRQVNKKKSFKYVHTVKKKKERER